LNAKSENFALKRGLLTTQLSRETLSDQVAKYLLLSISEKRLQPGDSLPSTARLMEEFSVSLPVIREALKSLSALGIITMSKGKGAIVKAIDDQLLRVFFSQAIRLEAEPLTRLMEVRQPLEIQSAMLAARRHGGQFAPGRSIHSFGRRISLGHRHRHP
jgi:DNA-binding FadR family transcriptional regulator